MPEDWKEVEVPTLQTYLVKSEKREKGHEEVNGIAARPPPPLEEGGGSRK